MRRITFSLDDALADRFDTWTQQHGYEARSEAFRDLLRARLAQERVEATRATHCVATLTYVYDHHERQLARRLAERQHAHHGLTLSTLHVHLDHDHCLEVVALRGRVVEVRAFGEALIAEKGVHHGHLELIPVEVETSHLHGEPHVHVKPAT